MITLAWGIDDAVGEYISAQFPELTANALFKPHISVGLIDDDGVMRGAIALRLLNAFDGAVSIAIDDWKAFPPKSVLQDLFRQIFTGRKPLKRLSCTIARGNKKSRRIAEHLGFKLEGVKRLGYDGRQHGCIYGMLASECPWL